MAALGSDLLAQRFPSTQDTLFRFPAFAFWALMPWPGFQAAFVSCASQSGQRMYIYNAPTHSYSTHSRTRVHAKCKGWATEPFGDQVARARRQQLVQLTP